MHTHSQFVTIPTLMLFEYLYSNVLLSNHLNLLSGIAKLHHLSIAYIPLPIYHSFSTYTFKAVLDNIFASLYQVHMYKCVQLSKPNILFSSNKIGTTSSHKAIVTELKSYKTLEITSNGNGI